MNKTIYGINNINSKIKFSSSDIIKIFIYNSSIKNTRIQEIKKIALIKKIEVQTLPWQEFSRQLKKIKDNKNKILHQNIIAICKNNITILNENNFDEALLKNINLNKIAKILILDHITDPYNLGACIRSAEAMKIDFIIIPKNNSASVNSTVTKVSSGAIYSSCIKLVSVSNLSRVILKLKKLNIWIVGLDSHNTAVNICDIDLTIPIAFVAGSEGSGMKNNIYKICDYIANIPMLGYMNSLNISVAVGISLYELSRQRNFLK